MAMAAGAADLPWHRGERFFQAQTGVSERMERIGRQWIRPYMPEQHRDFFASLPVLMVGAEDDEGQLWATAVFGDPGFIQSPSSRQLTLALDGDVTDPVPALLQAQKLVGLLGIDLLSRRRNRLNGVVSTRAATQVNIDVDQSFGNCSQHITPRRIASNAYRGLTQVIPFQTWSTPALDLVLQADTFFIASAFRGNDSRPRRGIDLSHRGGPTGFIQVDDQQRLLIPDYAGNHFFNTLGNLYCNRQAGLLFIDFDTGSLLQLSGRAEVIFDDADICRRLNTPRVIRFSLVQGRYLYHHAPYLWHRAQADAPVP